MTSITIVAVDLSVGLSVWLIFPILIPMGWFWGTQFVQLMLMSEHDFPGRHDKQIWGGAFVFLFVFAPFAFWGWKTAILEVHEENHRKYRESHEPPES